MREFVRVKSPVHLRKDDNVRSKIIDSLSAGDELEVLEKSTHRAKCKVSKIANHVYEADRVGQVGYIFALDTLAVIVPPKPAPAPEPLPVPKPVNGNSIVPVLIACGIAAVSIIGTILWYVVH